MKSNLDCERKKTCVVVESGLFIPFCPLAVPTYRVIGTCSSPSLWLEPRFHRPAVSWRRYAVAPHPSIRGTNGRRLREKWRKKKSTLHTRGGERKVWDSRTPLHLARFFVFVFLFCFRLRFRLLLGSGLCGHSVAVVRLSSRRSIH